MDGTEDTPRSSNRRPKILSSLSLSHLLIESQHKMRAACSATDLVALACRQIGCNKKVSSEITDCSLQQLPLNSFVSTTSPTPPTQTGHTSSALPPFLSHMPLQCCCVRTQRSSPPPLGYWLKLQLDPRPQPGPRARSKAGTIATIQPPPTHCPTNASPI